MTENSDSQ